MVHFLFLALSLFFFGACIGSFCGVVVETNVKRSFWTGRSQCLTCQEHLKWYELIPIVSYVIQWGKCRKCNVLIPTWVISIELMTGLLWMLFGAIFVTEQYSIISVIAHLIVITMILMLAIEDIKTFSIPDRLSLPMIVITIFIVVLCGQQYDNGVFPNIADAILGSICGMMFYLIQMIVPGIWSLIGKKQYIKAMHVLFTPLFFPFWLGLKGIFGEKIADTLVPSIALLDNEPTWVGGGDVRLGILLGLILGPIYFWWTIGIGYIIGTLFWLVSRLFKKQKLDILPVAPLLFLGFCVTWMILILG